MVPGHFMQPQMKYSPNYVIPVTTAGNKKEATHFCDDCKELLCRSCMALHKGQKISRNHKILSATTVSQRGVMKQTAPCSVMCECSQNVGVASYCEDHDEVTCQTCQTIKHRKCKTISLSDKSQSYNMLKLESVFRSMNKMKDETDEFLKERNIDLQKLNSMTEECKQNIKSFRKELNKHFDVLEQAILKEMEQRESEIKQEIESHISSCSTTKQMIDKDLKLLEDVRKLRKKTDMLAADVKISNRLKEYKILLQEFVEESKMVSVTFKRNERLTTTKYLGDLNVDFMKSNKSKTTFAQLKVESSNQVELKLPDETQDSCITGCTFMADGQLVLCDSTNQKIKILSSSFSMKENLKLPSPPHDVSPINNSNAIITLPKINQLQYIQVTPNLMTGMVITLDKSCWGVEVVGEEIYVTCRWSGWDEVRCLDMSGKLKRCIQIKQDVSYVFTRPLYLAVSKGSQKIYVSDYGISKVTCLMADGSVVYLHNDPNLIWPHGICVDDEDNIIVCGQKSNNIHIVAADGKKAGYLLTSEHGLKAPCSLSYRHTDNSLIVSCVGHNKLFVYKMG